MAADRPEHYCWEVELDCEKLPYKGVYRLREGAMLQLSAFAEMARACAQEVFGADRCAVASLQLNSALLLHRGDRQIVQTSFETESPGKATFRAYSRPAGDENQNGRWTLHATALISF